MPAAFRPLAAAILILILMPAIAVAEVRQFRVTPFSQLLAEGSARVIVHAGPRAAVTAEGSPAAVARMRIAVARGVLSIGQAPAGWGDWRGWTGRADPVTVRVTVPALRAVRLAGSGDLVIDRVAGPAFGLSLAGSGDARLGRVAVRRLALALDGSGDIEAVGRADDATIALHGSGTVHAARLTVATAAVTLAGSGDVAIAAEGGVTGALAGSGDITVIGPAGCDVARSGSGDVRCAGDRRGGGR